jgi:hypothetical protein
VLSFLAMPREAGASVVVEDRPPSQVLGCVRYQTPEIEGAKLLWLRPEIGHRNCFSEMAVTVATSPSGEIVAVDLALSGP